MRKLIAIALGLTPSIAVAHGAGGEGGVEPWVFVSLAATAIAYAAGLARVWARGGTSRGVSRAQAAAFAGGWLFLVAAVCGPFDRLAAHSFSAHMLQHEMLMLVAAPLLVAGRPLAVFAWAFPRRIRVRLGVLLPRGLRRVWSFLTAPVAATFVQLAALWAWHAPRWFDAAMDSHGVHALEHTVFLWVALCFWWAVRGGGSGRAASSCASLFVTMIGSGALGALLVFSTTPWYASYAGLTSPFGWTPLEEQQVGGLLMWIPGGMIYMAVALWRVHRALDAAPRFAGRNAQPRTARFAQPFSRRRVVVPNR